MGGVFKLRGSWSFCKLPTRRDHSASPLAPRPSATSIHDRDGIADGTLALWVGRMIYKAQRRRRTGRRDDHRRRTAAVEIERVAGAECQHEVGGLAERHAVAVALLATVDG